MKLNFVCLFRAGALRSIAIADLVFLHNCVQHALAMPEAETNTGRRRDVKIRKLLTSNMPKCMRNEFPTPLVLWIEEYTVACFDVIFEY